ncbi:MAG: hypothetical protein M3041_01440 [Acidobacteriota bacterium]|nr:hypothetical protein [Acidobacteriota bacterium]
MPIARRKAIGLLIAIAVLVGLSIYCTWRVETADRRGWAGFSYATPDTIRRSSCASMGQSSASRAADLRCRA